MKQTTLGNQTENAIAGLENIYKYLGLLLISGFRVREMVPGAFLIRSNRHEIEKKRLGLVALTHGNEVIGLPIIEQFLSGLLNNGLPQGLEIVIILNNIPAFRVGKKFLEKDMNHMYSDKRGETESYESLRALEIIPVLKTCDFVIDFHQGMFPSREPFIILPYQSGISEFTLLFDEDTNVIILPPNMKGKTISHLVMQSGKIGITVEMGRAGVTKCQIEFGVNLVHRLVYFITGGESRIKKAAPAYALAAHEPMLQIHRSVAASFATVSQQEIYRVGSTGHAA